MAEFFGELERIAADLYPWRYPIMAGVLVVLAGVSAYGYRRGWHMWIRRYRLPVGIIGAPLVALAIFVGYDVGSPLFTNKTVEEEFPFSFAAVVPPGMDREDVELVMDAMSNTDPTVVDQAMPDITDKTAALVSTSKASNGASNDQTTSAEVTQPSATKLKTGSFRDQDSFHKGSGQATIYRSADGSLLLRLENLDVTNGPDLHVILSPHEDPDSQGDVKTPGWVDLGKLKGNRGNQNYTIPDNVDVDAQGSVVIYCSPFHVIFSVASLQDVS